MHEALALTLQAIEQLTEKFKQADWNIGVGELTAPGRRREVGMVSGQKQSGGSDPRQRITKEGDRMVRWTQVRCVHCILRKKAPDSDLKRWGEKKLIEKVGKPVKESGKKKVLVATARKLSVVMHKL